jgi:hypothetical protein
MAAHSEIEGHLGRKGKTFSSATAGVATMTAGNNTFSHQELKELIRVAEVEGYELVLTAGAIKVRPKDSAL